MKSRQPLRLTARGEAVRDAIATTLTLAGIALGAASVYAILQMIGY